MAYPAQHTPHKEVISTFYKKADPQRYLTPSEIADNLSWEEEDDNQFNEYLVSYQPAEAELTEEDPDALTEEQTQTTSLGPVPGLDFISSDDVIGLYLKEMSRVPLLSVEEEVSLAQRIEQGRAAKCALDKHKGRGPAKTGAN